jgi:MFS family permease
MSQSAAPPQPLPLSSGSRPQLDSGAWLVLLAAFLGWMFDGLEQGIFPMIARPALLNMLHTKDDALITGWNGYITAAWLVGAAAGGMVFGWLGDRIGRVRSMALSVLCYSVFTGFGVLAQHPSHLVLLRLAAGLGMGGEWALGVALVMEYWPNDRRPLLAGLIGMAANVGYLLVALLGMVYKVSEEHWRWMMLAGVSPAVLTFLIRLFVPESKRWEHAVAVQQDRRPLREALSREILPRTLLGICLASIALIGTWAAVQMTIPLWIDKLGKADPHPHLIDPKAVAVLLLAIGAIIGCFTSALVAGRFGRRPTYFLLCGLSLLSTAVLFRGFQDSGYTKPLMAMVFLVGGLTASFYGWMPLYLPEIFPTRMRATGQGIAYNTGRLFAAAGAIWGGNLFKGHYQQSAAVVTLIYIVGMIVIWFAPETKGKPLPE